jgi:predicted PurR-regulated permease PerM
VTSLIATTRETVRGAVYGMVLTAVVQGFLAGIGYWIAGVPIPLPLAAVTTIASFIPFGTPLVYTPICVVLTSGAPWWHGALLLGWRLVVVSMADNIIRPVFLERSHENAFGARRLLDLRRLGAFGLLGLFVGPVIMAVAQALWKEWSAGAAAKVPSPESQG